MSCPAEHRTAEAQRADRDWLSKSSDGSQLIASLSPLPALNFGCFEAGILIGSPVRGLRPSEAARLRTLKVPKPTSRTSCPFFNDFVMESNTASTALAASALVSSVTAATASTSSFLFTSGPPSCSMRDRLRKRQSAKSLDRRSCGRQSGQARILSFSRECCAFGTKKRAVASDGPVTLADNSLRRRRLSA